MSERLIKILNDALIIKGMNAIRDESGLSETTIREIANADRTPRKKNAFKLLKACGCSDSEALTLARECLNARARRAS